MSTRLGKQERKRRIVAELRANPTVRISTLADTFSVSAETVRRDIDELSASGLVSRTYGGAAATSMNQEPAVEQRADVLVQERQLVARLAVGLLKPGDVIMIDAGSTTTHFARRLAVEGLEVTVITNSLGVATALAASERQSVVLCPGDFIGREYAVYGAATCDFLSHLHADWAILGASGLTLEGPTEAHSPASWVKRAMLERVEQRALMVDHSKYDQRFLEVVAPLERFGHVITDRRPPAHLAQALEAASITVHLPEETAR